MTKRLVGLNIVKEVADDNLMHFILIFWVAGALQNSFQNGVNLTKTAAKGMLKCN